MDVMLGIATIVFAILLAPNLGWDTTRARGKLLAAGLLLALGLALPTFVVVAKEPGWATAGGIAAALGAIVLVLAALDFRRRHAD